MKRTVEIDWEHKDGSKGKTSRTYTAYTDSAAIRKARNYFEKKFGKRGYKGTLFQVNSGDSITAVLPAQK